MKAHTGILTCLVLVLLGSPDAFPQAGPYAQPFNFREGNTSATLTPITIVIGVVAYLINPVILYEDKKLFAGITKEFSVGFGKFGEHRTAFEYSFIFGGNIRHHLRFSYKYDLLLKKGLEPSHSLQGTEAISIGAGYFTDFNKKGFFPELTYGYSLRNHKLLIYPHVKLRYTLVFEKESSDIIDISFGLILGIANPFMDVRIRKKQ